MLRTIRRSRPYALELVSSMTQSSFMFESALLWGGTLLLVFPVGYQSMPASTTCQPACLHIWYALYI